MSVPIQPMADYVVVQAEEATNKTASGLYLPGNAQEKPKIAVVVATGSGVKEVKNGDRVIYKNEYESTTVKVEKTEYIILFRNNIIATVK